MLTQREYDELELRACQRSLAAVTDPGRQVPPTEAGRQYRADLKARIAELEARVEDR